jgi:hypothetical protein
MTIIPFSDSAVAKSDASGNITFKNFQQPRLNMWRTGSLSIVASDGSPVVPATVLPVTWLAFVGATTWGGWYNAQPSNLVQTNGPPVKVTGSNLAASTNYQCIFTGYDSDAPPPLSPLPVPAPPPSTPRTIVSNAVPLGFAVVQIGSDQPVIVGTSLEIFEALVGPFGGGPGGAVRLQILWSVDGTFVDPIEYDFDIALAANMRGLVLPNLAPFVRFNALRSVGATQMSLTVFTGLAPIVRPPITPNGVLLTAQGNIGPNAGLTIPFLYPYVGPAVLSVLLQNLTGAAGTHAFWVDCNGTNYQGTSFSWAHAIVDYVSDNNTVQAAVIQPRLIHVPPLINSITLTSQNPNTLGYTVSVVPLGP